MNREQQEMALWRDAYRSSHSFDQPERARDADAAVAQFRRRYPADPAQPPAAWYDDPPHPGEYHVVGLPRACWVDEDVVYYPEWDRDGERPRIREMSRAGRRVSPIVKPQEPTK